MNTRKQEHTLEIFSGSLLEKRRDWQPVKAQLPNDTYLLVTTLENQTQTRFMLSLGRTLREQGVSVFVLSVG
jgi:hypothetical protein